MATLTPAQSDWVSHMKQEATVLLDSQERVKRLVAEYNAEGYSSVITDAALLDSGFPDLTNARVIAGVVAVSAVDTALGDLVSGQSGNLLKLTR